jgi:hypothetical protein
MTLTADGRRIVVSPSAPSTPRLEQATLESAVQLVDRCGRNVPAGPPVQVWVEADKAVSLWLGHREVLSTWGVIPVEFRGNLPSDRRRHAITEEADPHRRHSIEQSACLRLVEFAVAYASNRERERLGAQEIGRGELVLLAEADLITRDLQRHSGVDRKAGHRLTVPHRAAAHHQRGRNRQRRRVTHLRNRIRCT